MNKTLQVIFYRTESGNEPVREWLKELPKDERITIGTEIKTVQFGWPLGMPLVKKLDKDLWEIRCKLDNKIARVLFTLYQDSIVLLHGFIKKSQKIPLKDLELAKRRRDTYERSTSRQ